MAYAEHYILEAQSKNGLVFTMEIWEKDYGGATETIECGSSPFMETLLAQSDDPFLPISSSQQSISAYLQDVFDTVMPDFLTDDDRKYWCKFYAGSTYVWQGFLLNDQVTVPFTTGRPNLRFDCTDGLALLKDIPYVPENQDINAPETLLNVILTCLNKINIPEGFFLNICVSYFAEGMITRGDDPAAEPFSQIFMPPRNWLNSDMTYKDCYTILEEINHDFGCQLQQAGAEWFISSTNQRFEDVILYTRYDQDGTVSRSGEYPLARTVKPYLNDVETTVYFRDNSQTKILLKGFSLVKMVTQPRFSPNYIDNALLLRQTMGYPTSWSQTLDGGFQQSFNTLGQAASFLLDRDTSTAGFAIIGNTSVFSGYEKDSFVLTTDIDGFGDITTIPTPPACFVQVRLTTSGGAVWYLNDENKWINTLTQTYIFIDASSTSISITSQPLPVSGVIAVQWGIGYNVTAGGVSLTTQPICNFANFKVTFQSPYSSQYITEQIGTDTKYKKEVEVTLGYQGTADPNFVQQGALLDVDGAVWDLWGRYPKVDNYQSLTRLLLQQYFNIFSKSVINLSANVKSIYSRLKLGSGEGSKTILTPFQTFRVQDTTGTPISASGKSYIAGSSTINYIDDSIQVTMLETSNTDIDGTVTTTNIIR